MGKVKSYAMSHQECLVCGKCFLPWETKHERTCSDRCEEEADQLYDEIADEQDQSFIHEIDEHEEDERMRRENNLK